jgi:benzoyl-CoA reductase/2-hydroxyglutaryl-CoA dehydratase subunit BcrC/BadD/HgdB
MTPLDIFKTVATDVNNQYLTDFKKAGGKIIGYQCSFLPLREIYHAVGMTGLRLRANEAKETTIGDTYYGPVVCSFPKCMLQMAGEGKYNLLDGLIISTGCDAMRRMYDCWRKAAEEYPGILPDFFYLLGIPHKSLEFSRKWFEDEIRLHIKNLEDHFSVTVTDEALKNAIRTFNAARKALQELDRIRQQPRTPVSGSDALAVLIAGGSMPMGDFLPLLQDLLTGLKESKEGLPGKRVMLVGSVNDDIDFVRSIEEEGCLVVADTVCFGSRFFENMVAEDGDPVAALSRTYLDDVKCPRMIGQYEARLAYMMEKAKKAAVDGIIFQNIRFCDLHGSENSVLAREFEAAGFPCLLIERDYGSKMETGRIKMRVEAFLRRLR